MNRFPIYITDYCAIPVQNQKRCKMVNFQPIVMNVFAVLMVLIAFKDVLAHVALGRRYIRKLV